MSVVRGWNRGSAQFAVLVVLAAAVGGCGSGGGRADPSLVPTPGPAVIREAVAATAAMESVSLRSEISFDDSAVILDGTQISVEGSSNFGIPRRMLLSADFSSIGFGPVDMLLSDTDLYLRGEPFLTAGSDADWLYVDLSSRDPLVDDFRGLASGTNDASLLVYYLLGIDGSVSGEGTQILDGAQTAAYSFPVDLERALEWVPEELKGVLAANLEDVRTGGAQTRVGARVWIDGEGLIRRVEYTYTLEAAAGGGTMTAVVDFADFGERVSIEIPPPGMVVPVTEPVVDLVVSDKQAQAHAHLAAAAALTAFVDGGPGAVTPSVLRTIEGSLTYVKRASRSPDEASIAATTEAVGIAVMSDSGTCFWLMRPFEGGERTFGQGRDCTGLAALRATGSSW